MHGMDQPRTFKCHHKAYAEGKHFYIIRTEVPWAKQTSGCVSDLHIYANAKKKVKLCTTESFHNISHSIFVT